MRITKRRRTGSRKSDKPSPAADEALLAGYRRSRSIKLRNRLVELHRGTVEQMARALRLRLPKSVDVQDLAHAGMWGLIRSVLLGLWDRLPDRDPLLDLEEDEFDESGAEMRSLDYTELTQNRGGPRSHPEE